MAQMPLYAFTFFYLGRLHELVSVFQSLHIVAVLTVLAIVSTVLMAGAEKHAIWKEREVRLVLFLAVFALAMAPFSLWPGQTVAFVTGPWGRAIVLFLLVATTATSSRVTTGFVSSLIMGTAVLSVFTILAARDVGGKASVSDMYDPNDLAMLLDCSLPFAALGAFSLRGGSRLVAIGGLVGGVVAVVKTVSRGGFVGLIVVAVLLVLRWKSVSLAKRLGTLAVGTLIMAAAVGPTYWTTVGTLFNTGVALEDDYVESGMQGRTELWKQGFAIWMKNPILGVGVGTYEIAEGMSHVQVGGKWNAAHNSFIQVGTEMGFVGFAAWVTLIVLSIRNARAVAMAARTHPELASLEWIALALEMSLYTYIVVGFALSQGYSSLLYFMCGLATALRLQVRQHLGVAPSSEPAVTSLRSRSS